MNAMFTDIGTFQRRSAFFAARYQARRSSNTTQMFATLLGGELAQAVSNDANRGRQTIFTDFASIEPLLFTCYCYLDHQGAK